MALHVALAALVIAGSAGCVSVRPGSGPNERRWEIDEEPYEQLSTPRKIGTNVGNGLVGFFDSFAQGFMSGVSILTPYGGFIVSKIGTVVGDLVGLIDDNEVTQPVFQGVLSRQFLRFGTRARGLPAALALLHDAEFDFPTLEVEDYTGDQMFHTDAYLQPSAVVALGAVIVSDIVVRPVGNLCLVFGAREQAAEMDEFGLELIEMSLNVQGP